LSNIQVPSDGIDWNRIIEELKGWQELGRILERE
jgi:hypothetical protein